MIREITIGIITTIIGLIITNNYWCIIMFFLPDFIKIKMAQNNFKNTQGIDILYCKKCGSKNIKLHRAENRTCHFLCYNCITPQFPYPWSSSYSIDEIENIYRKKYKIKNPNHFLSL